MEETEIKTAVIPDIITVRELAERLELPVARVVQELMKNGVMATINDFVDFETAAIVAEYLGFRLEKAEEQKPAEAANVESGKKVTPRPPVITVMGHVDHGKTSLLDAIRETNVVAKESGGITQHIGAYQVEKNGKPITFLDTPGHEAFSQMRAHGVTVTDIVVLVVAADDGVRPQTKEAVELARAAGVPIVVAITKVDKPEADSARVKKELSELELTTEEWGGDTVVVEISSKSKEGIDTLLEMLLLVSELKTLVADPAVPATGVVIEAHKDPGKGPVATVLVQNGTLRPGNVVQAGAAYGRVKSMDAWSGERVKEAGPSMPVRIAGLREVPQVADVLQVFPDEQSAREEATLVLKRQSAKRLMEKEKLAVAEISEAVQSGAVKTLNIVLKADVQGSIDALSEQIGKLHNDEVGARIIGQGVGAVSESDALLAESGKGVILAFGVPVPKAVRELADKEGVKISQYDVIYELLSDLRAALSSLLTPERIEIDEGRMKLLKIFAVMKGKVIFGGKVDEGKLIKGLFGRIRRGKDEIVAEGSIESVRREKEEVREGVAGSEYGIAFLTSNPKAVSEGDLLIAYRVEEKPRTL